jgi:hypothetical protein
MKKAFIVLVLGALVAQAPALAQAPAVRAARQSRVTPDMVLRKFYEVMSVTQSPEDEKEAREVVRRWTNGDYLRATNGDVA